MITYKIMYNDKRLEIIPARYMKGNRIALQAYDGAEPYAVLTVNLPEFDDLINDRYIFMDENNCPGITAALKEACLIEPTGLDTPSGFCKYPVVLWRVDMTLMFKRRGCDIIRISDPTPHEIGTYLHMAATANNTGDLELIQIVNHVKEVKVML